MTATLKTLVNRIAPWATYPSVILLGLVSHPFFVMLGCSSSLAAGLSVAAGGVLLLLFERYLPYRRDWTPSRTDVAVDSLYLALVQGALPTGLSLALAFWLMPRLPSRIAVSLHSIWPHDWPVVGQLALIILTSDLLRYGLHVAAHRVTFLWRFHALHHAPTKVYWLNAGRFHPVEKLLQYFLDVAPFLVLGVANEVITIFLVFYSLNALLQHSNTLMRLGVLNYVLSTAELHRWHHARDLGERPVNYGNNTILWDWLLGTRFLPDVEVTTVGAEDSSSSPSHLGQLIEPLVPRRLLRRTAG